MRAVLLVLDWLMTNCEHDPWRVGCLFGERLCGAPPALAVWFRFEK